MNWLVRNSRYFLFWFGLAMSGVSSSTPLGEYFNDLHLRGGAAPFTDITFSSTLAANGKTGKLILYLIPGDILQFVGEAASVPQKTSPPAVGGMIISTNTGLDFDIDNPHVQGQLRAILPKRLQDKVKQAFRDARPLKEYTAPVVVDVGSGFSPRFLCFVATDRPEGTFKNATWITFELSAKRIGTRITGCLEKLAHYGVSTVVLPMIGASKVDLNSGFLQRIEDRMEMSSRLATSTSGIVKGVQKHLEENNGTSVAEIMLVLWTKDVERLIPDGQLNDGSFHRVEAPGSYVELRRALEREIGAN